MADAIERALAAVLTNGSCQIGQIVIRSADNGYRLTHVDDVTRANLGDCSLGENLTAIVNFDDEGRYRPLKTAPNLSHGWSVMAGNLTALARALDRFYPGRLAVWMRERQGTLYATPLRETLNRQTGMYRIAARITDDQIDATVAEVCRSDGVCLRTILWRRDQSHAVPSTRLPAGKFEAQLTPARIPLLCQEACTILVSACRNAVKSADAKRPLPEQS